MLISLNNTSTTLEEGETLLQLLEQESIRTIGVAVAVNNRVVRKKDWESHLLKDNDQVVIIQATCGG